MLAFNYIVYLPAVHTYLRIDDAHMSTKSRYIPGSTEKLPQDNPSVWLQYYGAFPRSPAGTALKYQLQKCKSPSSTCVQLWGSSLLATVVLCRPAPSVNKVPGSVDTCSISPSSEELVTSIEIPAGVFYKCAGPSKGDYIVCRPILRRSDSTQNHKLQHSEVGTAGIPFPFPVRELCTIL